MGYSPSPQNGTLPEDLPADMREVLKAMDFEGRLEAARARRKIVLAQKRAAHSDVSPKPEQAMPETLAPTASFAEEPARQSALVRARPVIGGLSAVVGVFVSFAVIAERFNVLPPLQIFSASASPQVQAEPPAAIAEPSVGLSAVASSASSISREALREAALPSDEMRSSSPLPPGPEVAGAEAIMPRVAEAPSRIVAFFTPVRQSEAGPLQSDSYALPGTFAAPSDVVTPPSVSAAFATEPPMASDPVPALRAARLMDLRIFVPNLASAGTLQNVEDRVAKSGYAVTDASDVPYSISGTQVRYYQPAYREQAEDLARALGARARDFSDRSGAATEGVVELWLAGEGATRVAPTPAPVRSGREVSGVRTTRTPPGGSGLGAFLGEVIGGGRNTPVPNPGGAGPVRSPAISKPSGGVTGTDVGSSSSKGNKDKGGGKGKGKGGSKGNGGGKGKGGKGRG